MLPLKNLILEMNTVRLGTLTAFNSLSKFKNNNLVRQFSTSSKLKSSYLDISPHCSEDIRKTITEKLVVYPDFITKEEEKRLVDEVHPRLSRMKYEFDHWDDAIHGFRETEKLQWSNENMTIIERLKSKAFPKDGPTLKLVHVLDLAEKGVIKPHIDSVKFCGDTISGLSLLSDSIMKFIHHEKPEIYASAFLPRRSLYIMRDYVRYEMTHEILGNDSSFFRGERVVKTRRISVICRSEPPSGQSSSSTTSNAYN